MVPLVALAALRQEANVSGIEILKAFGVPGPYPLVESHKDVDKPEIVSAKVQAGDGQSYWFQIETASGRCLRVDRESTGTYRASEVPPPSEGDPPEAHLAIAKRGLSQLVALKDLLRPRCYAFGVREIITFPLGYDGHPFFRPSSGGYSVILDRRTGAFKGFGHATSAPKPDRTPSSLSQEEAVVRAKRYLATHRMRYYPDPDRPVAYGVGFDLPLTMPYNGPGAALGWILPRGETRVRLAWAVPYWDLDLADLTKNHWTGSDDELKPNTLALLYLDVATGERILSDDMPMERYP